MQVEKQLPENIPVGSSFAPAPPSALSVSRLTNADEAEVLDFLTVRIAHSFAMIGSIRSNGLDSPHNRGTFYGCRDHSGRLEGVALIGHATLLETRSEAAIAMFARLAQECRNVFMLLAEQETAQLFWRHYAGQGQQLRMYCRELLFEQPQADPSGAPVAGLRLATMADLDVVVPVHARLAYEETGVNHLEGDAEGFRRRCARRIEQGRTWVWIEGGRLIFKADIVTDAPEVIYLEGISVHPEERGKGYGRRCLRQLTRIFLERTRAVIVLVNEERCDAQAFYKSAGFKLNGLYDTLFLKPDAH